MDNGITINLLIYANELNHLTDFYIHVLGFDVAEKHGEYIEMNADGFGLIIHQASGDAIKNIIVSKPPLPRENTSMKPIFLVPSLSSARRLAKKYGGFIYHKDSEWAYEGQTICDGYDSEGNVIQCRANIIF